jgi:hypothetical protein
MKSESGQPEPENGRCLIRILLKINENWVWGAQRQGPEALEPRGALGPDAP